MAAIMNSFDGTGLLELAMVATQVFTNVQSKKHIQMQNRIS
jgi:hypothetical protein